MSSYSGYSSTGRAHVIDEEVAGLKARILKLHSERNALSSTCRLPTEILETIFIYCTQVEIFFEYYRDGVATLPSWVNISYVCRHWRNVALNCPTFWTTLPVTMSPTWTRELLARSKQAPLKVHVRLGHYGLPFVSHFFEQSAKHIERLQDLDLVMFTSDVEYFLRIFSSRAPRLQKLKITICNATDSRPPPKWPSLPFHGDMPALRTLELTQCLIPWHSFTLGGLTTLSLCRVPFPCRQDMGEFLDTLRCMQDLVHLYLKEDALGSAEIFLSSAAFHTFRKVDLPHLSRLQVDAPPSTLTALLSCINVPLKALVRLESRCSGNNDDNTSLSSLLVQRLDMLDNPSHSGPTIRSFGIASWLSSRRALVLTFSAAERDCKSLGEHVEWDPHVLLQISINYQWQIIISPNQSQLDGLVGLICDAIPLTHVQTVHVFHPSDSPNFWLHLLNHARFQSVRYLKLSEGKMPVDLGRLLAIHGEGESTNRAWLVPALEELELQEISIPKPTKTVSDVLDARTKSNADLLYDVLRIREIASVRGRVSMSHVSVVRIREPYCIRTIVDVVLKWKPEVDG